MNFAQFIGMIFKHLLLLLLLLFKLSFSYGESRLSKSAGDSFNDSNIWSKHHTSVIPSSTSHAKKIPLTLVKIRRSSWTNEEILSELRRTEKLYGEYCKITFSPIKYYSVDTSLDYVKLGETSTEWVDDGTYGTRPLVFFDQRQIDGEGSFAVGSFSNEDLNDPRKEPVLDLAFIMSDSFNSHRVKPPRHKGYSILAHELAHILFEIDPIRLLTRSGHNDTDGNILCGSYDCKGTHITQEQCDSIKNRFFH